MPTQSEFLLIHGFACDLDTSLHRAKDFTAGFQAFEQEISTGKATVFRWGIKGKYTFWDSLHPLVYLKHYLSERQLAANPKTLEKLHTLIIATVPKRIVCHSMGSYLLELYLRNYPLPGSVKQIVLLQSDISKKELRALTKVPVKVVSTYRWLDLPLWLSSVYHRSLRIGIWPLLHLPFVHHYFPSFTEKNLHTAVLSDKRVKQLLHHE